MPTARSGSVVESALIARGRHTFDVRIVAVIAEPQQLSYTRVPFACLMCGWTAAHSAGVNFDLRLIARASTAWAGLPIGTISNLHQSLRTIRPTNPNQRMQATALSALRFVGGVLI